LLVIKGVKARVMKTRVRKKELNKGRRLEESLIFLAISP